MHKLLTICYIIYNINLVSMLNSSLHLGIFTMALILTDHFYKCNWVECLCNHCFMIKDSNPSRLHHSRPRYTLKYMKWIFSPDKCVELRYQRRLCQKCFMVNHQSIVWYWHKRGTFFEERGTKDFTTPIQFLFLFLNVSYRILHGHFLSVLHQNKAFHNFHKRESIWLPEA